MGIRKEFFVGLALFSATLTGCGALTDDDVVVLVHEDDPVMNAAKAEARASLPEFWERLAKPTMLERNFGLKYDLNHGHPERGDAELIWTTDVRKDKDGRIFARLNNVPLTDGYVHGQSVEIPEAAIVDWQIEREGRLDGHYTTRILLTQVSPEEAEMIRATLW